MKLVVSKLLLLVAERSGPESVTLLGVAAEFDRRSERISPDVSTLELSNDKSGEVLLLVSWALSPTKMKLKRLPLGVGSPFLRVVLLALSKPPSRVKEGESPPGTRLRKMKLLDGALALLKSGAVPVKDIRASEPFPSKVVLPRRPRNAPPVASNLVSTALTSGPDKDTFTGF